MNRMEEYQELMMELEQPVTGLEQTFERAEKKRKRRNMVYRPLMGIAASFAIFIVAVNFSSTVAQACAQIPILRELAEAVTFSKSLTDAVENEYVQRMDLMQTDGEVTAKVEYLIVDQKQVNVFFKLDSDVYEQVRPEVEVHSADGSAPPSCSYWTNGYDVPNGELQSITIDFADENVPDSLKMELKVLDEERYERTLEESDDTTEIERDQFYVAHMDFLLEFDPQFTATSKEYVIDETVILEGQKITITDVAVYPTHMRINIEDDPDNTAWIKRLDFYILADGNKKFEPVSSGVTAVGTSDTPAMASFRAESSYFYEAEKLELVITGAQWLKKDMEKIHVDLETGKANVLPEGVEVYETERTESGWILKMRAPFRKEYHFDQILSQNYYDTLGNQYEIESWGNYADYVDGEEKETHYIEEVTLMGYHEKEVWVSPAFSHEWATEKPIRVKVE